MSVVKVKNLSKSYGPLKVLSDVSFSLGPGQKAALVGLNGTGKSTLLKILAGLETADGGKIELAKTARVAYLPQDFGGAAETGLSSGQKTRQALDKILRDGADLLLLDEPTNNLDVTALEWLEKFVQESPAAALIVSHDRRFLDRTISKIFELDWSSKTLTVTSGSYSDYLGRAAKELVRQKLAYQQQQNEIERLTARAREKRDAAERGAAWETKDNDTMLRGFKRDRAKGSGRTAQALTKRIAQMDKLERPAEREPLNIPLEAPKGAGTRDLELSELVVGYDHFKVGPISIFISAGRRVAFTGANGAGKSTLLKTITGQLAPLAGQVKLGSGVKIGNLMQEHENLPSTETLFNLLKTKTDLDASAIYNLLGKFGFAEEQIKQPIASLSPGGRARLLLALFAAQKVNTLILDEPTNHLDLEAIAALEEALANYAGTVLLVSHDRHFLDQAKLDERYELEKGRLTMLR